MYINIYIYIYIYIYIHMYTYVKQHINNMQIHKKTCITDYSLLFWWYFIILHHNVVICSASSRLSQGSTFLLGFDPWISNFRVHRSLVALLRKQQGICVYIYIYIHIQLYIYIYRCIEGSLLIPIGINRDPY